MPATHFIENSGIVLMFYAVKTRDLRNSKRGSAYPATYFILQEWKFW